MRLVYVIGIPGSGKSTAVRLALAGRDPGVKPEPVPHVCWYDGDEEEPGIVTVERLRHGFSGTDSLAMSIQPAAINWLARSPYARVLAEGDRLGNAKFFDAMGFAGVDLCIAWLDTPLDVAAERRAERGSSQNEAWVKGRVTKVLNLARSRPTHRLDGTQSPAALARQLLDLLSRPSG